MNLARRGIPLRAYLLQRTAKTWSGFLTTTWSNQEQGLMFLGGAMRRIYCVQGQRARKAS
jgi:hypothetical protein